MDIDTDTDLTSPTPKDVLSPTLKESTPLPKDNQTNTKEIQEEKKEPDFEKLSNPARVTIHQMKYLSFDIDPKYVPLKKRNWYNNVKKYKTRRKRIISRIKIT